MAKILSSLDCLQEYYARTKNHFDDATVLYSSLFTKVGENKLTKLKQKPAVT